jgi:GNAT superfamily N-acetyltransferase
MGVPHDIVTLSKQNWDLAKQSILNSFAADPMMRWMVPDDAAYETTMSEIFEAFARPALHEQTGFVAHGGQAVAVWLPPNVEADNERMSEALRKVVSPGLRNDVGAVFGEMGSHHSQAKPCWYLPLIGVEPRLAGHGLGTALMKHALAHCDAMGLQAYLDSSNPMNIPFYERLGFSVQSKIQSGTSPISYAMLRGLKRRSDYD